MELVFVKSDVYITLSLERILKVMYNSHYANAGRTRGSGLNQKEGSWTEPERSRPRSGITRESLVRFERGQVSEFGSRKLLAVLAVLGLEMSFTEVGASGTLDELRRERGGA